MKKLLLIGAILVTGAISFADGKTDYEKAVKLAGENKITDFKSIKNLERLEHLIFDKVKTKEEIKEILPKNLYDNGKIDNEEYNEGNITRIYTKMILWRSEYVKI